MHNAKSILENETHELLRDFEIQTDHLILARRPGIVRVKKENQPNNGVCHIGRSQSKNGKKSKREKTTKTFLEN